MKKILVLSLIALYAFYVHLKKDKLAQWWKNAKFAEQVVMTLSQEPVTSDLATEKPQSHQPYARFEKSVATSPSAEISRPSSPSDDPWYLTERVKRFTDHGVEAIAAGSKVEVASMTNDGKATIKYKALEFEVDQKLLTRDKPALVTESPVAVSPLAQMAESQPPVKAPLPVAEDHSAHNARVQASIDILNQKISSLLAEIQTLENRDLYLKKTGKISSNGVKISKLKIQIEQLEKQRNNLIQQFK